MGVYLALLFSLLTGFAIAEEAPFCDSSEEPLLPASIFVTEEQYQACKEYGLCSFRPECMTLDDAEDIDETLESKSYFQVCKKIHFKMERLEAKHPEIRRLKLKLMSLLDKCFAEIELESSKGELVMAKILDFVKSMVEKLKAEMEGKTQQPYTTSPIPHPEIIEEEITAEPEHEAGHSFLVGSIRGIPGIHFPNYTEIPLTSFSCSDKTIIPGFYADLETGCQVFHLCYEHRRESFLCPVGTIFNQPILACDYWYSANCSLAPIYYEDPNIPEPEKVPVDIVEHPQKDVVKDFMKFLPVKAKVTELPIKPVQKPVKPLILEDTEVVADKIFDGILSLGSHIASKTSNVLKQLPDPQDEFPKVFKPAHLPLKTKVAAKAIAAKKITSAAKLSAAVKLTSAAAITSGKIKMGSLAAAAIPVKTKVAKAAIALPIKAAAVTLPIKAKAAILPIVKTKAVAADVFLAKAKVASKKLPIVKGKMFALPLAKVKFQAAAIPAFKAKKVAMSVPYLKMAALKPKIALAPLKVKSIALPIVKAKLAKAAISPLTKKALALGYLKLLKAKKLALMG